MPTNWLQQDAHLKKTKFSWGLGLEQGTASHPVEGPSRSPLVCQVKSTSHRDKRHGMPYNYALRFITDYESSWQVIFSISQLEVKYREDTRPRSQLEATHHQHGVLCQHLRQAAANVSLHTIILGVGGTIYSPHSLEPLKHLGLDPQKVTKLAVRLHAHSVQYAYWLVSTRCALENTFAASHQQDQEWGTANLAWFKIIPLIPIDFFCFLVVEESYDA